MRTTSPRRCLHAVISGSDIDRQEKDNQDCSCAPRSTLSLRRYVAPPQDAKFENAVKFGGVFASQGRVATDRCGRNLACKCRLGLLLRAIFGPDQLMAESTEYRVPKFPKLSNIIDRSR